MTTLPIACSLAADSLLDLRITMRRNDRSRAALDEIVRAERDCCPWMDLRVTTEPETLVLEYRRERG
jgi:hypothetical protein